MGTSDVLKKFFQKQRDKYRSKSIKDVCLSSWSICHESKKTSKVTGKDPEKAILIPPSKTLKIQKKNT